MRCEPIYHIGTRANCGCGITAPADRQRQVGLLRRVD